MTTCDILLHMKNYEYYIHKFANRKCFHPSFNEDYHTSVFIKYWCYNTQNKVSLKMTMPMKTNAEICMNFSNTLICP